ncbi:MAG: hypothetical protein ACLFNK_04365 [Candidatus Woesearchaeota archaeon]
MFRTLVDPLFDDYEPEQKEDDNIGNALFRDAVRQPRRGMMS